MREMATTNTDHRVLALAMLLIVGTQILGSQTVSADCLGSVPPLEYNCSPFVRIPGPKVPPSDACCRVLRGVDVPCLCKLVTPAVEKLINMEKVVYVARTCGLTVQPGYKCGSYTVPPKFV